MDAAPPELPEVEDAGAFWRFSLEVYSRPGVADACLGLQDRRGADVNVLLMILWRARRGRVLDDATLGRLGAVSRDWQAQVVGPVRHARRAARRAAGPDLYERLKETELACERAEQAALVAVLDSPSGRAVPEGEGRRMAETGLRAYLAGLVGAPAEEEEAWVAALVQAAAAGF